jgi:hypothetical protein
MAPKDLLAVMVDVSRREFHFLKKSDILLKLPGIRDLYGDDIVRDDEARLLLRGAIFSFIWT